MKIKYKNIIFFSLLSIIAGLFLACKSSYILAAIENEIKLKKATAAGTVNNIVKAGSKLYCSNGKVLTKSEFSEGEWSELNTPTSGLVTGVASDGTQLYISIIDDDTNGKGVWVYDGTTWSKIDGTDHIVYVSGSGTVFAASNDAVFPVNGTSLGTEILKGNLVAAGGDYCSDYKAVYNSSGKVSDAPGGIRAIDKDGQYFLTKTHLYVPSNWSKSFEHGILEPTDAVLLDHSGKKILLVSSNEGGYAEIEINESNITKSKTIRPGSSGSTTPPGSAEQYASSVGKYPVFCIFAEAKNAEDYYIHLGANDTNYAKFTGLWGFYSTGKEEWNIE
ncbi:MAG: hypothetical protein P1P64_00040 [Treponemataceae bacterium]